MAVLAIGIGFGVVWETNKTGGGPPPTTHRILQETSFDILTELGDPLRKEQS